MRNYFLLFKYREKGKVRTFKTPPFVARSLSQAKENMYRAAEEMFKDVELLRVSVRALPNPRKRR